MIEQFQQGNAKYVAQGGKPWRTSWEPDEAQAAKPVAAVIVCSDIRFSPEQVLGLAPGELHVLQTVANCIGSTEAAGIEFAHQTDDVELVIVLGHSPCRSLKALSEGAAVPEYAHIDMDSCRGNSSEHASLMANVLREKFNSNASICVIPAHLDEETGAVEFFHESTNHH